MTCAEVADPDGNELVDEIGEHLSALLCDVMCGHLDSDLVGVADRVLARPVAEPAAAADPTGPVAASAEQPVALPVAAPYSVP
jgi:hypothetical protein